MLPENGLLPLLLSSSPDSKLVCRKRLSGMQIRKRTFQRWFGMQNRKLAFQQRSVMRLLLSVLVLPCPFGLLPNSHSALQRSCGVLYSVLFP